MKLFLDYTYKLDCENKINYFQEGNAVVESIPENIAVVSDNYYVYIKNSQYKQIKNIY